MTAASGLLAKAQAVLEDLAAPLPDRPDGLLPQGCRVDRAAWRDHVVEVDLTGPIVDGGLSYGAVEEIGERLRSALDPQFVGQGIHVRIRPAEGAEYRWLEDFVASSPYVESAELQEEVVAGAGDASSTVPMTRSGSLGIPGRQPTGALSGVVIYAAAGHGWTAGSSGWGLQRPLLLDMNEDYGNLDQLNYFVQYCFNAGATVVPFRPVGYQNNEVVLDNDDPEVVYAGAWTSSSATAYYENGRTMSGVSYRFATAAVTESATARYTPNLPAAGFYPVYAWAGHGDNRVLQKYRVTHTGGTTDVVIDHRLVGRGWIWLGNYHFTAGTAGYVTISNQSAVAGVVIADAIRFGNGIGDVVGAGPGTVSGYPRDEECSRYWAESETQINAVGFSTSIYDCCTLDSDDNVGTGARWAREMNATTANANRWQRLYVEYHSNAGGGRGAVALVSSSSPTTYQSQFATILGDEIETDMLLLDDGFEHLWSARSNPFSGGYGAISTGNNGNEFDATILEVAFHDSTEDTHLLLDPKVRDAVARSTVHGMIKFLSTVIPGSTVPLAFPPDRPRRAQAVYNGAGGVVVSWQAPLVGEAYGQAPTGYRIYRSPNGYGFDAGIDVGNVLTTTLNDIPADTTTYLRITGYNAGGESMPSETLAVRHAGDDGGTFLIVNGFDRVDRFLNPRHTLPAGTQRRPIIGKVNSFNYTIQQGDALTAAGATFDSCANEAVIDQTVTLAGYPAVAWISGEESSGVATFDATEQTRVTAFLNGGGNLLVSGAEIGWDLDNLANGVAFYNSFLRADYVGDDAATYSVGPAAGSIFAGLPAFQFDNGALFYDVDYPDRIAPLNGSVAAMSYVGGTGGTAAVVYNGAYKLVNMGFPFETITTATARANIMDRVVGFFFAGPFDADRDGDVDLRDLEDFAACLTGPDVVYPANAPCLVHDIDADLDVDLADFAVFGEVFTGP